MIFTWSSILEQKNKTVEQLRCAINFENLYLLSVQVCLKVLTFTESLPNVHLTHSIKASKYYPYGTKKPSIRIFIWTLISFKFSRLKFIFYLTVCMNCDWSWGWSCAVWVFNSWWKLHWHPHSVWCTMYVLLLLNIDNVCESPNFVVYVLMTAMWLYCVLWTVCVVGCKCCWLYLLLFLFLLLSKTLYLSSPASSSVPPARFGVSLAPLAPCPWTWWLSMHHWVRWPT